MHGGGNAWWACVWQEGMHGKRGMHARRACMAGGVCVAGGHVWQQEASVACMSLVNRMTDTCKTITLPQTSFAGGNQDKDRDLLSPIVLVLFSVAVSV